MSFFRGSNVWLAVCLTVVGLFLVPSVAKANAATEVQIIHTKGGRIITAHADRQGDTVYIGGLVDRPAYTSTGAHVRVWGVGKDNQSVFSKTTSVTFTGNPSLVHTGSYLISVSSSLMQKAQAVFVSFHAVTHPDARIDQ